MWLGSPAALVPLGVVRRGAEVTAAQLALVLRGRHAITGVQVLRPRNGAVQSFELTFWAPESLAWAWYKADDTLRARIEHATITAADYSLAYLTQQDGGPSAEFAAAVTLHVTTRTAPGSTRVPGPLLHAHCHLAAVPGADGILRVPDDAMLSGDGVMLATGAVGRAVLAEKLRELDFQIKAMTGPEGRYFEVAGFPEESCAQASGRTPSAPGPREARGDSINPVYLK